MTWCLATHANYNFLARKFCSYVAGRTYHTPGYYVWTDRVCPRDRDVSREYTSTTRFINVENYTKEDIEMIDNCDKFVSTFLDRTYNPGNPYDKVNS